MTQAHVFISGFVQGVGFRAYVKSKARKLGIYGWVRNLQDGRVEAILQGDKDKIEKLLKYCYHGPFFSKVEDIVVDWEETKDSFSEFKKEATV